MSATIRMTEQQLQDAVAELARTLGWKAAHFRPARTGRGWRTPVAYDGQGFPDLVLVRERIIYAELKLPYQKLTAEQEGWRRALTSTNAEYHLWRPYDWTSGRVESVLRQNHTLTAYYGAP